jgi:chemotaxis protein MotB
MEKRHKDEEHENDERWLLTYADLITLLMVFFVVMYAISKADTAKFSAVSQSMAIAFGSPKGAIIPMPEFGETRLKRSKRGDSNEFSRAAAGMEAHQLESSGLEATNQRPVDDETQDGAPAEDENRGALQGEERGAPLDDREKEMPRQDDTKAAAAPLELEEGETRLEHVAHEVESLMRAHGLEDMIELEQSEDGRQLTIRLRDSVLFGRGGADITPGAYELIDRVGSALKEIGLPVTVAGHTDNIPIRNSRFRSNWELSTARSTAVLVYLIDRLGFAPERISSSGYGEYHPVASNDTREGRAQNRRVEFILTDDQARPRKAAAPEPPNYAEVIPQLRTFSQAPLFVRI